MIQILHSARVESCDGKILDLEMLLNQVGGIFKPEDESLDDDTTLQAALSAQVHKTNYENRGAAMQDRPVPKRNSDPRNQLPEPLECDKLYQLVLDMKAEMGSMHKAMVEAGISFENVPNGQRTKNASDKGKQKNNFAGTARRGTERTSWPNVPWWQSKRRTVSLIPTRTPSLSLEVLLLWSSLRIVGAHACPTDYQLSPSIGWDEVPRP